MERTELLALLVHNQKRVFPFSSEDPQPAKIPAIKANDKTSNDNFLIIYVTSKVVIVLQNKLYHKNFVNKLNFL